MAGGPHEAHHEGVRGHRTEPAPAGEGGHVPHTPRRRLGGSPRSSTRRRGGRPGGGRADPATRVTYPSASSATRVQGRFFDTCSAPPLATLAAWRGTSPYTGVNIYFGGRNRGCTQPNLTADVGAKRLHRRLGAGPDLLRRPAVLRLREQALPVLRERRPRREGAPTGPTPSPGRPAWACFPAAPSTPTSSTTTGPGRRASRRSARTSPSGPGPCTAAATSPASTSTRTPGLRDLAASYLSTMRARPDAVWMARWDGVANLTGWPTAGNTLWASGSAPSSTGATTSRPGAGCRSTSTATSSRARWPPSRSRTGSRARCRSTSAAGRPPPRRSSASSSPAARCPSSARPAASWWAARGCGTGSAPVATSPTAIVSTPSTTGFSAALPRCSYPGQIRTSRPVNTRSGPGTTYANLDRPLYRGCARLRGLPEVGLARRHEPDLGPARRRPLGQRLLRLQPVEHHLQRTRAPLSVSPSGCRAPRR